MDQGQGPASPSSLSLGEPVCQCACLPLSPAVAPKGNGRILARTSQKCREGVRRRAPFSFSRRAYGDQGLSVQNPRKAFQALPGLQGSTSPQLPFTCPKRLGPAGQVSDLSVPMAQQSSEPTGPSPQEAPTG